MGRASTRMPSTTRHWPPPTPGPADESPWDPVDTAGPADGQQLATRRRPLLALAATLVVIGGFGSALSAVSDTVTSDPTPGGTAQVSAPKSPTEQPRLPGATASATPPGTGAEVLPAPTGSTSATSDRRDDEHGGHGGQEDQQREDGDRSGDD